MTPSPHRLTATAGRRVTRSPARRVRNVGRALLAAIAAALLITGSPGCSDSNAAPEVPDVNDPDSPPATAPSGAPEFPLPTDPAEQIRAAGLRTLPGDAEVATTRTHVDVIINDFPVGVPAGIGITPTGSSPLSTDADDGVVHLQLEIAEDEPPNYTLGQFFTLWGVRLDKSCVATYCADSTSQLLGFVNGQLVGDPASIALGDQDQVVVWFGPRGTNPAVPASFDFPPAPGS